MKYSDLMVWQKAMDLVQMVYDESSKFPKEERFGLANQLRRAAVSVPSNIAEGHGRKTTRAYLNHLSIAFGSLMEIETQLRIADRLSYLADGRLPVLLDRTDEIGKMLSGLMRSLSDRADTGGLKGDRARIGAL